MVSEMGTFQLRCAPATLKPFSPVGGTDRPCEPVSAACAMAPVQVAVPSWR